MISGRQEHFIVWRAYQGRVDSMQSYFGFRIHWLGLRFQHRALRPLEYALKSVATIWLLIVHRPSVTWVQLPPTPLLNVIAVAKKLRLTRAIVADCHHAILWKPWINTPFLKGIFRDSVALAIFHSDPVAKEALAAGFDPSRLLVLEDRPGQPLHPQDPAPIDTDHRVLFPSSFDADEPIAPLLEAARRLPDVNFTLTGDHSRAEGIHDLTDIPPNVTLAGWVSISEYKSLLQSSSVVISLTTQEGIQTSAAGEAVGNGKAMVLSDTEMLRSLYPKGAVYTTSDPDGLESSIAEALANRKALEAETRELRSMREQRWTEQAKMVTDHYRRRP